MKKTDARNQANYNFQRKIGSDLQKVALTSGALATAVLFGLDVETFLKPVLVAALYLHSATFTAMGTATKIEAKKAYDRLTSDTPAARPL